MKDELKKFLEQYFAEFSSGKDTTATVVDITGQATEVDDWLQIYYYCAERNFTPLAKEALQNILDCDLTTLEWRNIYHQPPFVDKKGLTRLIGPYYLDWHPINDLKKQILELHIGNFNAAFSKQLEIINEPTHNKNWHDEMLKLMGLAKTYLEHMYVFHCFYQNYRANRNPILPKVLKAAGKLATNFDEYYSIVFFLSEQNRFNDKVINSLYDNAKTLVDWLKIHELPRAGGDRAKTGRWSEPSSIAREQIVSMAKTLADWLLIYNTCKGQSKLKSRAKIEINKY